MRRVVYGIAGAGGLLFYANSFTQANCSDSHKKVKQLCLCGPSGAGKSTLMHRLQKEFPDSFGFSVSHTTRKPRAGEQDGVDYHFTTIADMKKGIEEGKFIEFAEVHGNIYGTSIAAVKDVEKLGRICILDIDVQGVDNIKRNGASFGVQPLYVFIAPPSLEALEARLKARKSETEESLAIRLSNAKKELAHIHEFENVIVNDNIDDAYSQLRSLLLPSLTPEK
eukprot:c5485_g1_i1.p1 GENE.c5485_g1_i1~~c5485_g1_i1.p1  ORF type:complete len:224 (+),score=103.12 c5485_g1_i1:23-694(+)